MGQKVNPLSYRLTINKNWQSRWLNKLLYPYFLAGDTIIRNSIRKKLGRSAGIAKIEIERGEQELKVIIHTSRPGVIIGRSGKGIQEIKNHIVSALRKAKEFKLINNMLSIQELDKIKEKVISNIKINITEIRNPEMYSQLVAENIANQLEKRMPYRKVVKQTLEKVSSHKEIKGVKICVSGRLGGVDIARREKFSNGSIPLATLRAQVDYASVPAQLAKAGTIGIKVWIYTGIKVK